MAPHLDRKHRRGQHQCDPEALPHVDQFRIGSLVERNLLRLERHAADRASPRADLPHLRIHRAGVDRAGRHHRFGLLLLRLSWFEEFFGVCFETLAAARAAKQIFLALIFKPVLGGLALDLHAADRIDRDRQFLVRTLMLAAAAGAGRRLLMIVAGMIMVVVMAGLITARRRSFRAVYWFVLRP